MGLREYVNRTKSPWGQTYDPTTNDQTGRRQLHDTDIGFSNPTREAARINLQSAMSSANPEDYKDLESMRGAYRTQLSGMGNRADYAGSALGTDMQRGLAGMLQTYKNQAAGSGRISSPQYNRGEGDIVNKLSEQYVRGLQDLEGKKLGQLGQIQQGFGGIYQQDASERDRQFGQAKSLSDLLMNQIDQNMGRESGLAKMAQDQKNADRDFWSGLFKSGAMAAAGGA